MKEAEKAARLRFSSFSGGGYEYSVKTDEPSIVRYDARYEFEANAEELDGASYDYIVTFTGLRPGVTTAAVYGRSPILESENRIYTVTVDESLRVTLTPVRTISTFFAHRYGEIRFDSYQIILDPDGYYLSVSEGPETPVSADMVQALMDVIDAYDICSWDGFSEEERFVLDGEGFQIYFTFTDGTSVQASGDNAFPEHYFEAMNAMWNILERTGDE